MRWHSRGHYQISTFLIPTLSIFMILVGKILILITLFKICRRAETQTSFRHCPSKKKRTWHFVTLFIHNIYTNLQANRSWGWSERGFDTQEGISYNKWCAELRRAKKKEQSLQKEENKNRWTNATKYFVTTLWISRYRQTFWLWDLRQRVSWTESHVFVI